MAAVEVLHSDRWGDILDRPADRCVEIRWYDTTSEMSGDDFNGFLEIYAGVVERCGRAGALIDAVQFKMDMAQMDPGWRDENIIPRYNAAGLRKFAFIMPPGMPAIGAEPAPEGPAKFPTAYFGARADALAWLDD
ncbi:MAG: hypothetical protein QF926_09895 [Alphaproteobacteria bacterium]|jgi:hypothetical protein|nr:hypothetical protein [Alphaproteobacteria bacterium]|tara:strand:- start:115 stop:519 length:405 start_codon:yes stop_codon:yes gene_type:complete